MRPSYRVFWSSVDREYVGLCDQHPSLSWLDKDPVRALRGIVRVVREEALSQDNQEKR